MFTALRFTVPALALLALAFMVSSFAPIAITDFDRFTLRIVGVVSLLLAYVAFEARNIIGRR